MTEPKAQNFLNPSSFKQKRAYHSNFGKYLRNTSYELTNTNTKEKEEFSYDELLILIKEKNLDLFLDRLSSDAESYTIEAPYWLLAALEQYLKHYDAAIYFLYHEDCTYDYPASDRLHFFAVYKDKISDERLLLNIEDGAELPNDLLHECNLQTPFSRMDEFRAAAAEFWYTQFYTSSSEGGIFKILHSKELTSANSGKSDDQDEKLPPVAAPTIDYPQYLHQLSEIRRFNKIQTWLIIILLAIAIFK